MIRSVKALRGNVSQKFKKMLAFNAAFAHYNRDLSTSFTTLAAEPVGTHHGIEPEIRRIYNKYQTILSNLILQGKKGKVFKKEIYAKLAALVIIAFHDGILLRWFMDKDVIDGEAYVNTFKKIILNGLMM